MKLLDYALPLSAALLLLLFLSGLPDLRSCPLPAPSDRQRRMGRRDLPLLLLLCAAYALTAFTGLGDRTAPQSFVPMAGREIELHLDETPAALMLYTGAGAGYYTLTDEDGRTLAELEQDHAAVFKWHELPLEIGTQGPCTLRLRCAGGDLRLGELVFRDAGGAAIPLRCDEPLLCDEQETAPASSNFHNSTYFDEIYHARTAWEHLNGLWPYEISHPPLGKEILSLGVLLFGMTPFGWRFMGTLFGVLMLPAMYALLKRLFGGRAVPTLGTAVLAADFMHYVQTRIATIDTYGAFFILLMYLFLLIWLQEERPWALALCGLSFGLGAASKWTGIYAGSGLALLWALHWLRRRGPWRDFLKNCGFCLIFFVALPALIYYFSYLPYGAAQRLGLFTREYTAMVLHNQQYMFSYHAHIVAEHPYSSRWYQWLLNIRPILYYLEVFPDGSRSEIAAFLNPALCWGGLLSLFVLLYTAIFRRDRTALFILLGYLSQLLPWVFITRLTFAYHYFPSSLFLVLALGYLFDLMHRDNPRWRWYAGGFTAAAVLLFILYLPALRGTPVNGNYAKAILQWLPTWPLLRALF